MGAWDMLTATTKVERLRDRHRDYYLELAEQAEPELRGPDQVAWLDLMEAEHDNLRAAFEWSLSNGDADAALRIGVALERFWVRHPTEGRAWLERAAAASSEPSAARACALVCAGDLARDFDRAASGAHLDEGLAVAREVGDRTGIVRALCSLSHRAFVESSLKKARSLAEEALELARALGERHLTARALFDLAAAVRYAGSWTDARPFEEEALALAREIGDKQLIARSLYHRVIEADRGPERTALQHEYVQLCRELRDDAGLSWALDAIGYAALFAEGVPPARAAWDEALLTVRSMAEPQSLDYFLWISGVVALFAGDVDGARAYLEEAREIGGQSWVLSELAELAVQEGDAREALSLAEEAVAIARRGGSHASPAEALQTLGTVRRALGDNDGARAALEEALSSAKETDAGGVGSRAARSLGVLVSLEGDVERARTLFEEARYDGFGRAEASTMCLADLALRQGEVDQASELYRTALAEVRDGGFRDPTPWSFEGLAGVAAAQSRPDVATRLLGAAERFRENFGCVRSAEWFRPPYNYPGHDDYDETVERLRASLGEEDFGTMWDEGRAMTEDQAVDYAMTF